MELRRYVPIGRQILLLPFVTEKAAVFGRVILWQRRHALREMACAAIFLRLFLAHTLLKREMGFVKR